MIAKILTIFFVAKNLLMGYNKFNLKCGKCFYNFEPTFTFMGFLYRRLDVRPPIAVEGRKSVAVAHLAFARRQK